MRIDILSAVPDLLESPLKTSIIKRAQDKGKLSLFIHNLRDYAYNKHKQIDDKPFGGGPGMVLKPEPFFECIESLQAQRSYDHVIFTTPKGKIFNQKIANDLSLSKNIIVISTDEKKEILVPFVLNFIEKFDAAKKRLILNISKDFFEDDED